MTPVQLITVKNYYQKLCRSLEREAETAGGPTRLDRIAALLYRANRRLEAIYAEFERRAREKSWPPPREAYGELENTF